MRYMKLTENEKARHPSIHYTGSIRGMKKLGFWKALSRADVRFVGRIPFLR